MSDNSTNKTYHYSLKTYLNEVSFDEIDLKISSFGFEYVIGGRLPFGHLTAQTKNLNTLHNAISELSRIYIEVSGTDDSGKNDLKCKFSFFIIEANFTTDKASGYTIEMLLSSDLSNKASLLATPIKQNANGNTVDFIRKLFSDDGTVYRKDYKPLVMFQNSPWGDMTSNIRVLDMLNSKSIDSKVRNFSGITKLEAINEVISDSKIQDNKCIGHYFAHNQKTGALDLTLFDINLRCKSFQPRTLVFEGRRVRQEIGFDKLNVSYSSMEFSQKGTYYTATYWQREVESYANNEVIRFNTESQSKSLFKDGMDYCTDNVYLNGKDEVNKFVMFRSGLLLNKRDEPTNKDVEKKISNSRANYLRTTRALQKLNVKVKINGFVSAEIGDIWKVHFRDYSKSENNIDDKLLTGNYMICRVVYEFYGGFWSSIIVFSRDSYVK